MSSARNPMGLQPRHVRDRRLLQARRRKRRLTLFKKAHELGQKCGAEVYVLVRQNGRYYSYTTSEQPGWPPKSEDVLISYPLPVMLTADDFSDKDSSCDTQSSSESHTEFEDTGRAVVRTTEKPLPLPPCNESERSTWASQWCNDAQSARGQGKQYLSPVYETAEDTEGESDRYDELPCIYVP